MESPIDHAMNETVAIVHKNGDRNENIPALVNNGNIITTEVTIPLSAGDKIERSLPSGQIEALTVTNAHLTRGHSGLPSFYTIEYVREGTQQHSGQPTTIVNVLESPQARINFNSTDQSTNVINNQTEDVFSQIRELLTDAVANSNELDLLLERVEDMERNRENGNFTRAYQDFIVAAAAHMTILAPVIPMLTTMLNSAGG